MAWQRPDGRQANQLRPVHFERHFTRFAAGSVLAKCGETQVLCTVSIQPKVPRFLEGKGQGWLTAEYRMLPSATLERQEREFMRLSGRTQEIQRLIGRSLRSTLDMAALESAPWWWMQMCYKPMQERAPLPLQEAMCLREAIEHLLQQGSTGAIALIHQVAAISIGLIEEKPYLDLNYEEDVIADTDFNVVMNENLDLIEMQGTAEAGAFSRKQLDHILDLAELGIKQLQGFQLAAFES